MWRWPVATANAVAMAERSPVAVSTSAVTPCRCNAAPTGAVPRSTASRQRPSNMLQPGYHRVSSYPPVQAPDKDGQRAQERRGVGRAPPRKLGDNTADNRWTRPHPGVCATGLGHPARGFQGRWGVAKLSPSSIHNVCLIGHHGAGKTALAEALLAATGTIPRLGSVEKGTTVCDFEPEETQRQLSVSLSIAPFELDGIKVNVLDVPGYADFSAELAIALAVTDLAVVVVSATDGVQGQTEDAWRAAAALGLPRMIVITKLDRERADFSRVLDEVRRAFGAGVAPVELPIGSEASFRGVIDLLDDTATLYDTSSVPPVRGQPGPDPRRPGQRGARGPRATGRGHRGRRRRPDGPLPRGRDHRAGRAAERPSPRASPSGSVFPVLVRVGDHGGGHRSPGQPARRARAAGRPPLPGRRGWPGTRRPRSPATRRGHRCWRCARRCRTNTPAGSRCARWCRGPSAPTWC